MKTVTQQQQAASQYNGVAEKRVDFGYDLDGDVSSVTRYAGLNDTSPVVATSSYGYDAAGQLESVATPLTTTTYTRYDALGRDTND